MDWFVNEVIKLEIKMAFYFKNTKKDIMTDKDEEVYKKTTYVDFVKKKYCLIKLEIIVILLVTIEVQLITLVI